MANIRYILLSCVLALLVNKINGYNNMLLTKGSTAGRKISLERYVMPPSQREHIIDNLEEKCKPNELVGLKMGFARAAGGA